MCRLRQDSVKVLQFRNLMSRDAASVPILPFALLLGDGRILSASRNEDDDGADGDRSCRGPECCSRCRSGFLARRSLLSSRMRPARLHVTWRVILRDGSNYIRQEVVLTARCNGCSRARSTLGGLAFAVARMSSARSRGRLSWTGCCLPASKTRCRRVRSPASRARCWIERELPLKAGQSVTYSSVIGVAADGQMRRGFLRYVERERAHPYRTFLNYNSWYDLGYFSKYDEADALERHQHLRHRADAASAACRSSRFSSTMAGTILPRCGTSTQAFPTASPS